MKKLILSVFAVTAFICTTLAQPFTLTADGFRSADDKDYIVVNVPDCDKATLFQRAKNYFTLTYNSPQNVMSESGTDAISILGTETVRCKVGGTGRLDYNFSYKLICEFKDGRAKITPVWVNLFYTESVPIQSYSAFSGGVYRKNGELRDKEAKDQIEAIINPLVLGLESALKETATPVSDEW